MGKKSPPPKPPDLTPISNAQIAIANQANELAREQMGLSREQFAYYQEHAAEELALAKQQADRNFALQEQALASSQQAQQFAQQVGQVQMDAMNQQMGYAEEDRERYESVFLPMQDRYITEANAYDTPERREAEAARQMVDVQRQADAQRANADARLRSMGVDPSQVSSGALMQQLGTATAANQALAGNMGRQNIEDRGRSLRESAINMGNGLPAQSMAGYGGATNSGNSAMGAAGAGQNAQLSAIGASANLGAQGLAYRQNALQSGAQLTGSPTQWAQLSSGAMGQAMNGMNNAGATLSQGYNNSLAGWNAGQQQSQTNFGNLMSIGSMAAGMFMAEGGRVGTGDDSVGDGERRAEHRGGEWKGRVKKYFADRNAAEAKQPRDDKSPRFDSQSEMILRPIYQAEGGRAIPRRQSRDKVPAMLSEGEYVLPADVVSALGIEKLDKLVSKYHRSNA